MTFQTLKHIHSLLLSEVENRKAMLDRSWSFLYELEEKDASMRDIDNARAEKDVCLLLHGKAQNALDDFESHEWR